MYDRGVVRIGSVLGAALLVMNACTSGDNWRGDRDERSPRNPSVTAVASTGGSSAGGKASGGGGSTAEGGSKATAGASGASEAGAAGDNGAPKSVCPYHTVVEGDSGELLFDTASCDSEGRALFVLGEQLYWLYERPGKSLIVSAPKQGGTPEVLVEAEERISLFDVNGSVTYRVGDKVYVLWPSSSSPVALEASEGCIALTSTIDYVYCRTEEGSILRWARTGRPPTVLAIQRRPGRELLADPRGNQLLYDEASPGTISHIPMVGLGSTGLEHGALGDESRIAFRTGSSPHSLRLLPEGGSLFWMERDSPSRVVSGSSDAFDSDQKWVEAEGLDDTTSFALMSSAGLVLATPGPDESSQLSQGSRATRLIDYQSNDGVVALAAEQEYLYWLDRKARVFRGKPRLLSIGDDDAFSSSLDRKRLRDLSLSEAMTLCGDLTSYYRTVTSADYVRASCVSSADDDSLAECEAATEQCVESNTEEWQPPFDEASCFSDLAGRWRGCAATVAYFSACFVAEADGFQRFVATATCKSLLDDSLEPPRDRSEYRECVVLEETCPPAP